MKVLATILAYAKYVILPPFAALVVWTFTSFSSSFIRYYPRIVAMLDTQLMAYIGNGEFSEDTTVLQSFYYGLTYVLTFLEKVIVYLNFWIPVDIIVNVGLSAILISLQFVIMRIYVKLITVGQI